jgi:FixJ family two-component response regulator
MEINRQDITVFVVDDEFVIRDSLSLLIESTGLKVETFDSAITFLEQVDIDQPGCLILDMRIPYMDGLELQEELVKRNSKMPIIFMSGHADIQISSKAFRAGAIDFIEKPFDSKLLLQRIDEMIEQLLLTWPENQKKKQLHERYMHLTPREKEIFLLTVHNHSNKQAAKKLNISNRTVDVHRAHIMEKMQADSLNTLIIMAMNLGLM